jgi:hypothetical protein
MTHPMLKYLPVLTLFISCISSSSFVVADEKANAHHHHGHSQQHKNPIQHDPSSKFFFPGECSRNPAAPCSTSSQSKQKMRKAVIKSLYDELIYPAPKAVLADPGNANDIFEASVIRGRVTPAGEYDDFEGAVEYFYGLALTPQSRVDGIKVRSIVASDTQVAIEVDLHFCQAPYTGCDTNIPHEGNNRTIRQIGFYTFNGYNKVISFDLTILNLGKYADVYTEEEKTGNIIGVCTVLTRAHFNVVTEQVALGGTCTSDFDGAEDFAPGFPVVDGDAMTNCVAFMKSIPYGTWDQAASNTFTCRSLHSLLTPLRPIHCAHTNYTGGGKCVDKPYGDFFQSEY